MAADMPDAMEDTALEKPREPEDQSPPVYQSGE
jgi:hypothetical protein